ncbi:MAG: arsenic resistance N-acetyltransferase ArsN2 [Rhodothermales bacterium]
MSISFRRAEPSDLEGVLRLLDASELTTDGLEEGAALVLVAAAKDGIVACAALEVDGSSALLRSLAVASKARGTGLGKELVSKLEEEARNLGVGSLYLLTTTAEGFFDKLGYRAIDRAQVPDVVRASAEFPACSSAGATVMRRFV